MLRILFLSVWLLCLCEASLAAHSASCGEYRPFDGVYVNSTMGVATSTASFQRRSFARFEDRNAEPALLSHRARGNLYRTRFYGQLTVGLGCTLGGWAYVGGRVGLGIADRAFGYGAEARHIELEEPYEDTLVESARLELLFVDWIFDAKIGAVWCNTLVYGLAGVALNRIKGNFASAFTYADDGTPSQTRILVSKDRNGEAFLRVGLGLEQMIGCGVSLCGECTYTWYGKLNGEGRGSTVTNQGVVTPEGHFFRSSVNFRRQITSIGLNYYF